MEQIQCSIWFYRGRITDAGMPQFDVHRNSGKHKDTIPFVVVLQCSQFDSYRRRVVVPLVRASAIGKIRYAAFHPTFKIRDTSVATASPEIVYLPVHKLGEIVGPLNDERQPIVAAMAELFTRAWQ